MSERSVESLYEDFQELRSVVANDPSGLVALERTYPKVLVLASASYLEHRVKGVMSGLFQEHAPKEFGEFMFTNAMVRGYHTLFNWDQQAKGVNGFFAAFGEDCKLRLRERLRNDAGFTDAAGSFIEMGQTRNTLVHNNYAEFQLDKTVNEILLLHQRARLFPEMIGEIALGQVTLPPDRLKTG
jgi:hypothetical protein